MAVTPVRPPLCSAEHIFKEQPTHLLGQLPCCENMRQEVCLSRGPPHQSRSHTETSAGCFPSTLSHLAMIPPTQVPHVIHSVCRQEKCVICQPSWVKRVKNHPLNFWAHFLCKAVCCYFKQALIVRWADNPSASLPSICQSPRSL